MCQTTLDSEGLPMTVDSTAARDTSGRELDGADDHVHRPAPGVRRWTENIQWNVFGAGGVGVLWHIGTMIDDPTLWHVVVMVRLPDGTVYGTKQVGPGVGGFGTANAQM